MNIQILPLRHVNRNTLNKIRINKIKKLNKEAHALGVGIKTRKRKNRRRS